MKTINLLILSLGLLLWLTGCSNSSKPATFHSVNDLRTGSIGVLMGSAQDAYVTQNFPETKVLRIDMSTDLGTALNAGTCDVAVFDAIEAANMLKAYPNMGILEKNLMKSAMGVGFQKEQTELRDRFDAFLARIQADGTYREMEQRWMGSDPQVAHMPAIDLPAKGSPLRVGTTSSSMPYSYVKDGKPAGFDMEIIYRFAAIEGRPVELKTMNFGGLIPALSSGKVDVIINCIMITPERSKEVAFSEPYAYSIAQMLALKKNISQANDNATTDASITGYRSIDDLKGKRIAVLMGSTHDAYLTAHYPDTEIMRCESESDALLAVDNERADAALIDNFIAKNFLKKTPNIAILTEELFLEDMGIGFSQKQTTLRDRFNIFLKETRASGLYDEILRRWTDSITTARMPQLNVPTDGTPLKVGITGTMSPFGFVREGKDVGFDVELISRFAIEVGRPVNFLHISFGGLIAALGANKVDLVSAGMVITPERAKSVAFSDPYFNSKATLLTLKKNIAGNATSDTNASAAKKNFFTRTAESFHNNILSEQRYLLILDGLGVTLLISLLAALLGTLFGAAVCYLRMSRRRTLNMVGKVYITLMRGIPVLVLLMLMYYVVFAAWDISATVVAILAFALNFAAYVSEMFRSSIQGIDRGQTEAGIALGFTPVQTFRFIILPQAVKSVLPVYKGELISLVKMTSVVGYIAVSDLTKASDIIRSRTFDAFFPLIMVAVLYFLLAWAFASVLDYFNNKTLSRK